MAAELCGVVDFDCMFISQWEQDTEKLWVSSEQELHCVSATRPDASRTETLTRWVYEHQEPLVIASLNDETRFVDSVEFLRQPGLRSLCVLPLTTAHRRIGSMGLASRAVGAYTQEETRFLSLVVGQVAAALDDALNFKASKIAEAGLKDKNERLQLLLEINNTLVANLEFRDLLREISSRLRSLMRCDGAAVVLSKPSMPGLRLYAVDFPGAPDMVHEGLLIPEDSPISTVFESGEPAMAFFENGSQANAFAINTGIKAYCHLPLTTRNRKLGVLALARTQPTPFDKEDLALLTLIANQVAIAVENAIAFRQIAELKDRLAQEKVYLEDEIRSEMNFDEIVGRSAALKGVLQQLEIVAPTDSSVLIFGETGTGKELIARALHDLSSRAKSAFVKLNCAAIPTGLLESELFGHERGAFTGAVAQRIGRFELANHGTVFLDEIAEITLELQPKLLRVLQEREFERLGSSRTMRTDARLIAATNRDLTAMVSENRFRADLFYRLNVFPLYIPPLRERTEDIPLLVRHFVQQFARRMNRVVDTIPSEAMSALVRYHWPGNIRELQNVIERAVIVSTGPFLKVPLQDLQAPPAAGVLRKVETLEEVERRHILEALDTTNWVIAGAKGAAAMLGLKRSTLQARMEKLGIRRARTAQ
ncbi:MAG: sigma 54-interacting transcriptional regulator [Bryobacterales bacterium]|nr:sigma 54-interacting transcriptional regulator [Bryobacterales bacterium]